MEKTEEQIKKEAMDNIKEVATKSATEKVAELKEEFAKFATKEEIEEAIKANKETNEKLTKLSVDMKKQGQFSQETKVDVTNPRTTLKMLEHSLVESVSEKVKQYNGGDANAGQFTEKAITPLSFGSAEAYESLNTDRSLPLDANPYAPVYLRNIFPNVSTSNKFLSIWKRGEVTGKAKVWKRGTGTEGADEKKPMLDMNFTNEIVEVNWIPAMMKVQAEVLEDVEFMNSEISNALIYSDKGILAAENEMITEYIRANAVDFAKDADYAVGVEKLLAAAFGQLGDKYMTPTHILINSWDFLTYLSFNKAGGSGEYDLPSGDTVKFINGRMFVNSLEAVRVPELNDKEAYVVASQRSRFVNRQEIRTRVFESNEDDAQYNMVLIRAEKRAGFFTYDNNSLIKVTLPTV